MYHLVANPKMESQLWGMALALVAILLLMIATVVALRLLRNIRLQRGERQFAKFREPLLAYLQTGNPQQMPLLPTNESVRNALSRMGLTSTPEQRQRLLYIYARLGFAQKDYEQLSSIIPRRQAQALRRLRDVLAPLPDRAWRALLLNHSPILRWGVMGYLVAVKQRHALPWFFGFIFHPHNYNRRVMIHLLSTMARHSTEAVAAVLSHSDDPIVLEACLRVLAAYPNPQALPTIARVIRSQQYEIVIAGIQALSATPTPELQSIFIDFTTHSHWVVRMLCARAMASYPDHMSVVTLNSLTEDQNYYVRREAIRSLMHFEPEMPGVLDEIRHSPSHPSFEFMSDSREWIERTAS